MDERRTERLENIAGTVGFAMHADRLAKATRNLRLLEAEMASKQQQRGSAASAHRTAMATTLIALAARIAPPVARPNTSIPALGE